MTIQCTLVTRTGFC